MTTRVIVAVNGSLCEAHVYREFRNEHGEFVRTEPLIVRGNDVGDGGDHGFVEVLVPDHGQVVVTERYIPEEGASS